MADETITIDVNDTSDGTPDRPSEVTSQSSTDAPNEALQRTLDELAGLQRDRNAATATDSGGIEADFDAFHAFNDSLGEASEVIANTASDIDDIEIDLSTPTDRFDEEADDLRSFMDSIGVAANASSDIVDDLNTAQSNISDFSDLDEEADDLHSFIDSILEASDSVDTHAADLTESIGDINDAINESAEEFNDLATEASGLEAAFDAMREEGEAAEGGGDDEQENHAKGLARTGVQVLSLGRAMGLVSTKVAATAAAGIALTAGLVTVTGGLILLAAGVVGAIFGMIAFNKVITKVADDIKGFSPATMAAKIDQTITALENKIKLAQVAGDEVGGVVDAQTSFQTEASELFRTVIDAFAPLLTIIINILAIIFDLFNQIAKPILDFMGTIVDLISEIFIWILEIASRMWFIGDKAQEILDKMTKDPDKDDMLGKHIQGLFNPRNVGFRGEHKAKQDERQEHFDEVVDRPRP